jgi:hypothetical protein
VQVSVAPVIISSAATTLVSINRRLELLSGNLTTNGNLRLAAGNTRTAFISGAGSGTITGNVIAEKKNMNGYGYHYFGVPVSGSTFSQLSDDITLSGTDGLQYVPNFATPLFATCWRYDETNTNPDVAYGWVGTVAGSSPIETGRGYATMITQGAVLDVTGPVNHGSFTSGYSVSRTPSGNSASDGYNLISNPYPSPISWNALRGLPGQVDFAASYFAWRTSTNSYSGNYGYFNGTVGTLGVNDTISSFQGFKVIKVSAGSQPFIANNGIRINSPTPALLRKQAPATLRLRLEMGNDEDEAVAYVPNEGANDDAAEKVRYPFGNLLSLSVVNAEQKSLAIYPEIGLGSSRRCLPLLLDVPQAGAAHFLVQTENWAEGETIWLEDRLHNAFEKLEPGQPHYLNLPKGEVAGRLFLHLAPNEASLGNQVNITGNLYYQDGVVYLQPGINSAGTQLDVLNLLGQKVFETTVSGQSGIVRIPLPNLHGTFLVQAIMDNQRQVIKVVMP